MMKNLTDIMDSLTPEELDRLLPEETETEIEEDRTERILKTVMERTRLSDHPDRKRRGKALRQILLIAASAVLAAGAGAGIFAVRAEAMEYRAAVRFFSENGLSSEGLTRGEIKEIYRDITADTFGEEKTAALVRKSLKGYRIEQEPETPEELKKAWSYRKYLREEKEKGTTDSRSYRLREEFREDPELGFEVFDRSILECYAWGELVHSTEFTDFWAEGTAAVSDGVMVWGSTWRWDSEQDSPGWIMKAGADGEIQWTRMLEHSYSTEQVRAVLQEEDGSLAVFGIGDYKKLSFSRFSSDGEELLHREIDLGENTYGIRTAAPYQNGYLVVIGSFMEGEEARILRIDQNGAAAGDIRYDAGDKKCVIRDVIAFKDRVYLSAYLYKAPPDASLYGGYYEVAEIVQKVLDGSVSAIDLEDEFRRNNGTMTQEEYEGIEDGLTPLLREHYQGILLVCDPEEGELESFYEVPGTIGGALRLNEYGQMEWDTESFSKSMTTLMLSSSSVVSECTVFRYTFDPDGNLICGEQTDEMTDFRR